LKNIIYAHPQGIGAKYADRDDLDKEIARVRAKTTTRPVVQVSGGRLPWVIDEAEQHLLQSDQEFFQRGSLIVRPVKESIDVTNERQIIGTRLAQVRPLDMRETFSRVADFQKFNMRRNAWLSVDCPRDVAETYLQREGKWQLPVLTRIITAPTLRSDGSILEEPGYDERTGLLFEPQGVTFRHVPLTPDLLDDVVRAASMLQELLKTFPFVDEPAERSPFRRF
jgi:putative DNA primase/helicase